MNRYADILILGERRYEVPLCTQTGLYTDPKMQTVDPGVYEFGEVDEDHLLYDNQLLLIPYSGGDQVRGCYAYLLVLDTEKGCGCSLAGATQRSCSG